MVEFLIIKVNKLAPSHVIPKAYFACMFSSHLILSTVCIFYPKSPHLHVIGSYFKNILNSTERKKCSCFTGKSWV